MDKELEKKVARLQNDFDLAKKSWRTLKNQTVPEAPNFDSLEKSQIFENFEFLPDEQQVVTEYQQKLTHQYLTLKSNFSEFQEQVAELQQELSKKEAKFAEKVLEEMLRVLRQQLNKFNQTKSVFETSWQFYTTRLQDFAMLRLSALETKNPNLSDSNSVSVNEVSPLQDQPKNLPIGSVVLLKKRTIDIPIMTIGISENTEKKYTAVLYPTGYAEGSHLFSFNHEDVDKILFRGYQA